MAAPDTDHSDAEHMEDHEAEEAEDDHMSDSQELADSESSSEDMANSPVAVLACANCQACLSLRGQRVHLVADYATTLFSSDLPASEVESLPVQTAWKVETCSCRAVHSRCRQCRTTVGYLVVEACVGCRALGDNGHYWLFHPDSVVATTLIHVSSHEPLTWESLPYNGRPVHVPVVPVEPVDEALVCLLCSDVIYNATTASSAGCSHILCEGCFVREVEARKCCPFDRKPLPGRDVLEPCWSMRQRVDDTLVWCRYGCKWESHSSGVAEWVRDPAGCCVRVRLADRIAHEGVCAYSTHSQKAFVEGRIMGCDDAETNPEDPADEEPHMQTETEPPPAESERTETEQPDPVEQDNN